CFAKYGMNTSGASWDVGAGYLNGARDKFSTSNAAKETTGAWDVNGRVGYAGFDLLAEYVSTIDNVYDTTATTAQNRLFAWDIGADYNFPLMGKASAVNVDYSRAKQAVAASQWVIGFRNETFNNVWMGLEYSSSKGAIYNDGTSSIYNPSIAAQPIATSGYDGISNSTLLFDVTAMF
ncbi:MAG: hypothetical protein EBX40_03980, partial [Gammaproteobacteria bacterium]|nr:hypothetical protein [Gammaproteobacteria bacterium]